MIGDGIEFVLGVMYILNGIVIGGEMIVEMMIICVKIGRGIGMEIDEGIVCVIDMIWIVVVIRIVGIDVFLRLYLCF